MIKIKYVWKNDREIDLYNEKTYECVGISRKLEWLKVIDESKEDYCYPPELFDLVEDEPIDDNEKELFDKVKKLIDDNKVEREKW